MSSTYYLEHLSIDSQVRKIGFIPFREASIFTVRLLESAYNHSCYKTLSVLLWTMIFHDYLCDILPVYQWAFVDLYMYAVAISVNMAICCGKIFHAGINGLLIILVWMRCYATTVTE